jgi:hypothetical protein
VGTFSTEKEALEEVLAAGAEERALAIDAGEVDKDGVPYITVAVDGSWSKRSYKSNYNALSGVATIIGARTKKVLYVGVKNRFRKNEHTSFEQKTENLTNDILNAPAHIFGDHSKCAPYFSKNVGQVTNVVEYSEFLNSSLFISFIQALKRVATLSSSLLYDVDNNSVESYNSIVNKFVGGKRINFSLRGSYWRRF